MAVVHIISPISFLILLSGAYLTAAMPICKTVNTQNIHLKRLQSTMNLTRHLTNETHSCNQSLPNCVTNNIDFLCNLAVLHVFTNESSFLQPDSEVLSENFESMFQNTVTEVNEHDCTADYRSVNIFGYCYHHYINSDWITEMIISKITNWDILYSSDQPYCQIQCCKLHYIMFSYGLKYTGSMANF